MAKDDSDNNLGFLAHLLGILTGFIGPLITYWVAEDDSLKEHSKKALNWQFSLLIYLVISIILAFVLIGFLFLVILSVLNLVFPIIAIVKATNGELWDYPLSIRFFKSKENV